MPAGFPERQLETELERQLRDTKSALGFSHIEFYRFVVFTFGQNGWIVLQLTGSRIRIDKQSRRADTIGCR